MNKFVKFAAACAAAACAVGAMAQPLYQCEMTVGGYAGATALENFPVLVRISPERIGEFKYGDCQQNGADISFTDMDGTALAHEVDTWDVDGESLVWVKVPTLSGKETKFKFRWCDAGTSENVPTMVWAGYAGVWHLGEQTGNNYADSTGHGLTATNAVSATITDACEAKAGKVGDGRWQPKLALRIPSYDAQNVGGTFTASGWFYMDERTAYESFFNRKQAWDTGEGWQCNLQDNDKNVFVTGGGNKNSTSWNYGSSVKGRWVYVSLVYNGTKVNLYENGAKVGGDVTINAVKDNGRELVVGSSIKGTLDEIRIRDAVGSADWVKADYDTVTVADFVTAGTTEILSTKAIVVSSEGAQYGEVSPAYGQIAEPVDGTQYNFSCTVSTQMLNEAETTRAVCTGWTLQKLADGTEIKSSASEGESPFTCSHTYVQDQGVVLKWCWQVQHKVTAEAAVGGTVSSSGAWVASGDSFTATATPADGCVFYSWTDGAGKAVSYDASLTLPVTEPIALTAHFGGSYYVAKDGSDENDGLTRATAKLNPVALIPTLPAGSTVYVDEGTYEIKGDWIQLTNDISVVGIGEDRTKVVFKNTRTDNTNARRIMRIASAGSRLVNVTLSDGFWESYRMGSDSPGALRFSAGVVSNCVIKSSTGSDWSGGGVQQSGGLLTHSLIYANKAYRGSNAGQQCYGGGVLLTGGFLEHCVISNNTAVGSGGGVYQTGGTNRFNRICKQNESTRSGRGVYISGGLMERCEIDHNTGSGSTVTQVGGTARNCFIHDNTVADNGGGVTQTGGTFEYNTVVNNKSLNLGAGGIYLNNAKAVSRYNVSYLNGSTSVTADCNLRVTAGTSTDDVATDPSFVDAANGDFTLAAGSPAIDIVEGESEVVFDFAGNVRPKDGDGDGVAQNDAGCFEAPGANEGPFRCSLAVTGPALGLNTLTTSFKASVAGEGSDGEVTYSWDFDGDGSFDLSGTQYATAEWTYETFGHFDVRLVATAGGKSAEFTYPSCTGVGSSTVYMNAANAENAKWPYASWETAAADINEAYDTILWVDGVKTTMYVTNGTYDVKTKWLQITKPFALVGVGDPAKTILRARNTEADTKRRVLYVAHAEALVTGFTLREGNWQAYNWGDYGAGALRLSAGVVSNCIFTANSGHVECGGGAEVIGGLLTHSLLYENAADHGSSGGRYGRGGGVMLKGGIVEHCVISNNNCNGTGQGIYQTGGTNRYNRICKQNKTSTSGAGVMISGGLMELCEIDSNTGSASTIDQSGGMVRNCFIHDNTVTGNGGGVTMTGGTFEYCTLVNNKSVEVKAGGIYLNQASGKNAVAQYCVTYLNGDVTANPSCNLSVVAGTTTAVVSTDPSFANPNAGDFTLGAGSAAIDAAEADREDVAVDFAGNVRPKDGNGDHDAVNDCGCFEAPDANEGPMRCSLAASQTRALESLETTFTASVNGSGSEGPVTYSWDFDGDGIFDTVGTGEEYASVTTTYSDYGYYDVILKTENGDNAAVTTNKDCIGIGTATVYVNAANKDGAKWPYATWETAAADINVAYDTLIWADGVAPEFIVTNGTYEVKSKWLMLKNAITLRSVEGPSKTILKAANPEATDKRRVLYMNHPDAWVEGFNLNAANWQGYAYGDNGAGALRLEAGTVTNCIISGSQGQVDCSGGAEIKGGLLTHTVIRGNTANQGGSSGSTANGAGLRVSGGIVEYCVITNNYINKYSPGTVYGKGGGLYVCGADAIVRNCVIADNYCTWTYGDGNRDFEGSQVWVSSGLLENCTIGDMKHGNVYASGVYQSGGTIRNCLLRGMYSANAVQALKVAGGSFYNNTVVTNGFGKTVNAAPVAAEVTGGEVVNCIFAANAGAVTDASGLVRNSCYPEADGERGNLATDPKLRNPARGDWRVRSTSPCVNAGDNTPWEGVEGATDVRGCGYPRILNKQVDIGCYEIPQAGLRVIVR